MTQLFSPFTFGVILTLLSSLIDGGIAMAQIIPDNSLGAESSRTRPDTIKNTPSDVIEGGATRGSNLFHSFLEFNINEGRGAYFANPARVENIFTRVTGSNRSDILGKLGVLGTANLLLLNPNGILFGSHASLDIQGSFLATTANTINLGEGFFSASQPDSSHLLSVNLSALFFNQVAQQSGNIVSQANLSVGKDLTLVAAGNLNINGNIELDNGGNIALVSKGDLTFAPGISVTSTGLLGGKITLNSQGMILVDGSSITTNSNSGVLNTKGGDLEIIAQSLKLDNDAKLLTTTSSEANAGDVWIQIAEGMTLDGESILGSSIEFDEKNNLSANIESKSGNIYLEVGTLILKDLSNIDSIYSGVGNSGSILLKVAEEISLTEGSLIRSDILGQGNTGNITIEAPNAVTRFDGRKISEDENGPFVAVSGLSTIVGIDGEGKGNAGKIYINAKSITLTNGAAIISSVFGQGNAGNIDLIVADSLTISEGSRLLSFIGGIGDAGDITVNANNATVMIDGIANLSQQIGIEIKEVNLFSGIITVIDRDLLTNEGQGKGGDVNITARTLAITNGSQIFTNNLVQGSSGNILINVSDSLFMNGGSALRTDILGQGLAGNITINAPNANLFFDGIANIPIYDTNGKLSPLLSPSGVSSNIRAALGIEGEGEAKDIEITAKSLTLNNGAAITATTIRNQGGNITLNLSDRLLLRNQSDISATAGLAEETGDGGNITINSPLILAIPEENSDITANAFQGKGGQINITTKGIFGIQFREAQTPLSDITASSRFDVQGTVTITNPNDTLVNRLGKFTENIVDVASLVTKNVCGLTAGEVSSLIVKGRGGLPPNPSDPMMPNSTVDWVTRSQPEKKPVVRLKERSDNTQPVIQQVQGWKRSADGTIVLTADATTVIPQTPTLYPPNCY